MCAVFYKSGPRRVRLKENHQIDCAHNSDDAHKGYNASEDYGVLFASRGAHFGSFSGPKRPCTATVSSSCYSFLLRHCRPKDTPKHVMIVKFWQTGGKTHGSLFYKNHNKEGVERGVQGGPEGVQREVKHKQKWNQWHRGAAENRGFQ